MSTRNFVIEQDDRQIQCEILGDKNILLEFDCITEEDKTFITKCCLYFGGIGRWTTGIPEYEGTNKQRIAFYDNQVYIECEFAGSSSDPLGFGKNVDFCALHEIAKIIKEGITTKSAGLKIIPPKAVLEKITTGWDIEKSGWKFKEIYWVEL